MVSRKKTTAATKKVKKADPVFQAKPKSFRIGQDILPAKRDLGRYVRWPRYVRLQRQKKILLQRLKVPPSINQFSNTLDKSQATALFKLLAAYRPETKKDKQTRLKALADAKSSGGAAASEKPGPVIKFGIHHVTTLVEEKKAKLVVIASDVDPLEIVLWQMPVYTDKELGRWIAQQGSIIRHIARRTGLGGKNAQDEAVVDMIFEGAKDIWGKKDLVHEGAASESADAKKLQMYLTAAARMLGDKMYFVYDTPTYADVAMFHVLLTLEEIVAPASSYLSDVKHPNLVAFVQRFKELPSIKIYLASDRRVPITAKEMGKGSSDYNYMAPLSDAVLAHIDSVKTEL